MEFRNHHIKIMHRWNALSDRPLAAAAMAVLFVVLLIPLLAMALLFLAAAAVTLPFRIGLARWLGRRQAAAMPPFQTQDDIPSGPILDAEVTHRRTLN